MAFSSGVIWECRTTGNNANGGGFNSAASGTDRSQQDAAQTAYTDLVIDGTTNTNMTSAGNPFTSADAGNIVNITGGTGFTVQRVEIISVSSGVATADKSLGTLSSTGGTGNLGGAVISPGLASGLMVAGNTMYVKYHASNTYDVSSTTANVVNGRVSLIAGSGSLITRMIGYDATRGDLTGNKPKIRATTNTMTLVTQAGARSYISNIWVDAASATGIQGIASATNSTVAFCKATACNATSGINGADGARVLFCEATGCSVQPFNGAGAFFFGCIADANTDDGWDCGSNHNVLAFCYSTNNSGAGTDGFLNSGAASSMTCIHCVAYNNGQNGFANVGVISAVTTINCIAWDNTSNGITAGFSWNSAAGSNGTDFSVSVASGNITLSADPFTDAANDDYSLNSVAGGGALLRGEGILGAYPATISTTSHNDVGGAQTEGGSVAGYVINSINAQFSAVRGAVGY